MIYRSQVVGLHGVKQRFISQYLNATTIQCGADPTCRKIRPAYRGPGGLQTVDHLRYPIGELGISDRYREEFRRNCSQQNKKSSQMKRIHHALLRKDNRRWLSRSTLYLVFAAVSWAPFGHADGGQKGEPQWDVSFFDDFESFNLAHWQDQSVWVNGEDHCYVPEGQYGTREVSDGTLKLRVVDLGRDIECFSWNKAGEQHPDTRWVAGRITSKNRVERTRGRWTARLRVESSGQAGMFPAWWLLGAYNNEPPIEQPNENVCWPLTGSGEIDIFEHHADGGANHYAARIIANGGACGEGDWQSSMLVQKANLDEYHEYSVEWFEGDMIFRLDGNEVYRIEDQQHTFPEPMFAILNFAKINNAPMTTKQWTMEVDWVKHEHLK